MNRKNVNNLSERQKRRLRLQFKRKINEDNSVALNAINNISNLRLVNSSIAPHLKPSTELNSCENVAIHTAEPEAFEDNGEADAHLISNDDIFYANVISDGDFDCECPECKSDFLKNVSLEEDLQKWITECNVPMNHATKLLHILKKHDINVPLDARTLLKTPRVVKTIPINPGRYCHIGLKNCLKKCFSALSSNFDFPPIIKFNLNIDSLPLTKSSGKQFWPILGWFPPELFKCIKFRPFIIGIYEGNSKPASANEFLKPFVEEFLEMERNGFKFLDKVLQIKINVIVCDAPAKAFIANIKGHNGYHGCTKCIQEGDYLENRMTFAQIGNQLRTDLSFKNKQDEEHHTGLSVLEELNIGMVSQIPLDYMHLVCLGVMKRLLQFWHKGRQDIRIPNSKFNDLADLLLSFKSFIPLDFARKPRHISELDRFKATEYRQILLYTGIVAFKKILNPKIYNHFLHLSCAIRILVSSHLCINMNTCAKKLLTNFIIEYGKIYGVVHITHNVHNLYHLSDEVMAHGCLDKFSAFIPESFMFHIKKKICLHSGKFLQQLFKRISEEPSTSQNCEFDATKNNPSLSNFYINGFLFNNKMPNNCCLLKNGSYLMISDISKEENNIHLRGNKFEILSAFFLEPINSQFLGINLCSLNKDVDPISVENINDIVCKIMILPYNNNWVVLPLNHVENSL